MLAAAAPHAPVVAASRRAARQQRRQWPRAARARPRPSGARIRAHPAALPPPYRHPRRHRSAPAPALHGRLRFRPRADEARAPCSCCHHEAHRPAIVTRRTACCPPSCGGRLRLQKKNVEYFFDQAYKPSSWYFTISIARSDRRALGVTARRGARGAGHSTGRGVASLQAVARRRGNAAPGAGVGGAATDDAFSCWPRRRGGAPRLVLRAGVRAVAAA